MRLCALIFAILLTGCSGCLKDGSSAIDSIGATGSYSSDTDTWMVGITITFKDAPAAETVAKLRAAGASSLTPSKFVLPKYVRSNKTHNAAIEACIKDGTFLNITGFNTPP